MGSSLHDGATIIPMPGRRRVIKRSAQRARVAAAVSIPEHLFTSRAFRALGVLERWLLVEMLARKRRLDQLAREHDQEPDDVVGCSVREAADFCGVAKSHAGRAMAKLEDFGFIAQVRKGEMGSKRKRGIAAGWRITSMPFQGVPATCDYAKVFDRVERQEKKGGAFFTPEMEAADRMTRNFYREFPADLDGEAWS
jgi:hypothetical protein